MSDRTITRAEITDALVSQVGLTRQDSSEMLDRTLELVIDELEKGHSVKLSRFGNFVVREKSAREGRNPKTGEQATITARKVVTFRPSPMLKRKSRFVTGHFEEIANEPRQNCHAKITRCVSVDW